MQLKIIQLSIIFLFFGLLLQAQRIILRPSLSFAALYGGFQSSTIPEPYFSSTFTRSAFIGIQAEVPLNKQNSLYLRASTYNYATSFRSVTNRKPDLFDFIFSETTLGSTVSATLLGAGIKRDITFQRKRNKLYLNAGINLISQRNDDSGPFVSGPFLGGFISNFSYSTKSRKKVFPVLELGISHPILNRKHKEILEFSFLLHHAFQKVLEDKLDYNYSGPRYGGPQRQQAIFASRAFSFQFVFSKAIGIKTLRKK